jgi:hypothetical protein
MSEVIISHTANGHPSCGSQLPNVLGISKLDLNYEKPRSDNGDGLTDGELFSTHTTPLNYMRRATPTAQSKHMEHLFNNKVLGESRLCGAYTVDISDLQCSISADEFASMDANRVLHADSGDRLGDSTPEAVYHRSSTSSMSVPSLPPNTELDLSSLGVALSSAGDSGYLQVRFLNNEQDL